MERRTEAKWNDSLQRWVARCMIDGKRHVFYSSAKLSDPKNKKGKIEAERKLDKFLKDNVTADNKTVQQLTDDWLASVKIRSEQHYINCEKYFRLYVLPLLGSKKMKSVTQGDFQKCIDVAFANKGLSKKTLSNLSGCINNFVKYCRINKATVLIFEDALTIPRKAEATPKQILSEKELKILFSDSRTLYYGKVQDDPYINFYRFSVLYGFRPSENCALMWSDINDGIITVQRGFNVYHEITHGKNKNAYRVESVSNAARNILEAQKALCEKLNINSVYVFPNMTNGLILSQKVVYAHWQRYCDFHKITSATSLYELRHTFCSINDQMPDYYKKMVMGHSKATATNNIYGHRKQSDLKKIAAFIDDAIAPYLIEQA